VPYIRLYSKDISLVEKRLLAEKLITIALDAFQLSPNERYKISVQFVPRNLSPAAIDSLFRSESAAAVLEVCDPNLTVHHVTAFVEAATPVLGESTVVRRTHRMARMLGLHPNPSRQIAFQFSETGSRSENFCDDGFVHVSVRKAA
jgi:hypothetical protein